MFAAVAALLAAVAALFAAVAVETDPVRRFALKMQRDELRLLIVRHRNDAENAKRHIGRHPSNPTANSPRGVRVEPVPLDADASGEEMCWYCRAPESDPFRESIDILARRCVAASRTSGRDCRDVFAAALYHFAVLLNKDPGLPCAKLVNRSVAWALHHLLREDFAEHNARERGRDGEDYQKWTWRLTDDVVEATFPGLRKALRADIASALADAAAFHEDIID